MIIVSLRTDKPEAELGLFKDDQQVSSLTWEGHKRLAETLHSNIEALLTEQQLSLADIEGLVCFEGPGSFTGLRIGLTVANALAYSYHIPVVATGGDDWLQTGIQLLVDGKGGEVALPFYGTDAIITPPKK